MVMLWPRETPLHTESSAERKVYDALKAGLPDGWQAWHSLRLRSRASGQFGEADWVQAIHKLWGETWTPSISLGGRVELDVRNG